MPLTPTDVHHVALGTAPLGRRGYDKEQVDAFLDAVTQDMIRLLEENDVLQRRAGAAADDKLSALTGELDRACQARDRAAQTARVLRGRLDAARRSAAGPRDEARRPAAAEGAEDVLALANRTAEQRLQESRQESQGVLADARQRSVRIADDARRAARDIERISRQHHSDAAAELQIRRTDLVQEVEGLTDFAASYRSALDQLVRGWINALGQAPPPR